jgi:hypothetical protein
VLHRCSATLPEVILNNSAILRVSSLLVGPKLAEEAHRRSTIMGTFYKRWRQVLCAEHCFIPPLLREVLAAEIVGSFIGASPTSLARHSRLMQPPPRCSTLVTGGCLAK